MLELDSWLHHAEGLQWGRKSRVNHDCGPGRTLTVGRKEDGAYTAWCFRCNEPGYHPAPAVSLATRSAQLVSRMDADAVLRGNVVQGCPSLPEPATRRIADWPPAAALWLFRAGLGAPEIGRLGAYFHEPSQRVVLPVFEALKPVFYQARAIDWKPGDPRPKYLAPDVSKTNVVPMYGEAEDVTLTEDILSAFKVGLAGEGWSMLGTSMSEGLLSRLLVRKPRRVNVWLDPDSAGDKGTSSVLKRLRAVGIKARRISSSKDPKLMFRSQIRELLA